MVDTVLLSSDVIAKSLSHTGAAMIAFADWKPKGNETVFSFPQADIHITAANGGVYFMSLRETKQAKIAFKPFPVSKIAKLVQAMTGEGEGPQSDSAYALLSALTGRG